jgi:glutamate 5-kinase
MLRASYRYTILNKTADIRLNLSYTSYAMNRIIIKVGTKVLTKEDGVLDERVIIDLVSQIATLRERGIQVVLVSSGAVGSGRALLGAPLPGDPLAIKQVYAAVGQNALMNLYAKYLTAFDITLAQILVTKEDFRDRIHYQNMHTCLENILRHGVLPIVNENDVIAINELIFTDNDELTGLLALQLDVDATYILTSVDGVILGDINDTAAKIASTITSNELREIEQFVTTDKSAGGRGGMRTKFATARKLMTAGIEVHLLNGKTKNCIVRKTDGEQLGTTFVPNKKVSAHKRKLAHGDSLARGSIKVNKCLEEQLTSDDKARSILPIGVTEVTGSFAAGDLISIQGENGHTLGCGLAKFDALTIKNHLGQKGAKAVVHYDDLFLFG